MNNIMSPKNGIALLTLMLLVVLGGNNPSLYAVNGRPV